MRYWGSLSHWIDIASRYTRAKINSPGLDDGNTRIDRQRRLVGLIMFMIFIGLPAAVLFLLIYFPEFITKLFP